MLRTTGGLKLAVIALLVVGLVGMTAGCKKNKKTELGAGAEDDQVVISGGEGMDGGEGYGEGVEEIDMEELPERPEGMGDTIGQYGIARDGQGNELLEVIYFDYDKSELRSDMMDELEQNASWILENPDYAILMEGHCDERGSNEYNLGLGQRRADAVLKFMLEQGIELERLNTVSYGEEMPAVEGSNPEAWARNRRVVFKVKHEPGA